MEGTEISGTEDGSMLVMVEEQLELDMEQWTGSKLGKKYVKAVYCHPNYLTLIQSTLCEVPG